MNKLLNSALLSMGLMLPLAAGAEISASQAQELVDSNNSISESASTIASMSDISRAQLAKAIVNEMADLALKEFNLQEEKMFMAAPGSPEAIATGQAVGVFVTLVPQETKNFANAAVSAGYDSPSSSGGSSVGGLPDISAINPGGSLANQAEDYISSGDANQLGGLNAANVMQEDVVQPGVSQLLINTLTNPIPPARGMGQLTDNEKAKRIIEQTMKSFAANSLGEMAARRVAGGDDGKSLAQLLREESTRRFENEDWYANVGISSTEALLREIAQMEAFRLKLQYEQYRLQEQSMSLMAAMLTSMGTMSGVMIDLKQQIEASSAQMEATAEQLADDMEDLADEAAEAAEEAAEEAEGGGSGNTLMDEIEEATEDAENQ